jgi:hypothetical protein
VIELRFHREIYAGEAIDAAVKAFDGLASFDLAEETEYWVVRLSEYEEERVGEIAGEFANHALGLTIERRGAAGPC